MQFALFLVVVMVVVVVYFLLQSGSSRYEYDMTAHKTSCLYLIDSTSTSAFISLHTMTMLSHQIIIIIIIIIIITIILKYRSIARLLISLCMVYFSSEFIYDSDSDSGFMILRPFCLLLFIIYGVV
jgi:hypothetical protein